MPARKVVAAVQLAAWVLAGPGGVMLAGCGSGDGGAIAPADEDSPPEGSAPADPPADPAPATPPERAALRVAFKLDPRLTGPLYMGDRWVSPPTYQAPLQTGPSFTVDARVARPGTGAKELVTWASSDPDRVAVAPAEGRQVTITVHAPGQGAIAVTEGQDSVTLSVDAAIHGDAWLVTIRQ